MAWSHIFGHERHVDAFRRIVARGRLAHAYLFVGPDGVGKRLFARELAKALLCEAGNELEACGHCSACLLVDADTHPDFFSVRRPEEKNELPRELVQELCRSFGLKSARGHGKVALLEDADDLNEESANCFLKTLEEPPPRSVFILLSSSTDRQLPTILSRCQTVRFLPLSHEQVRAVLKREEVEASQIDRLVRLAAGSPGQALALADPALWQFRRRLIAGLAEPRVDSVGLGRAVVEFVEEAGKEAALQRRRAALLVRLLLESLMDAVRLGLGATPLSTDGDDLPPLRALAQSASAEKLLTLIDRSLETEAHLDRYVQVSLVLEGLLDALGRLRERRHAPAHA